MFLSYKDFKKAVDDKIISEKEAEKLFTYFKIQNKFKFSNVLIYFGGIVLMSSMTISYSAMLPPIGGIIIILGYMVSVYILAKQTQNEIIQNILSTFLVALSPLLCYYILKLLGIEISFYRGYYYVVSYEWIIMEIFTMITAFFVYKQFKNSFLMLVVSITIWYFSLDFSSLIADKLHLVSNFWDFKAKMSILFGILLVSLAIRFDLKDKKLDLGFWLYIFGAILIWSGGSYFLVDMKIDFKLLLYILFNLAFLLFGVFIRRNVFLALSGIGFFIIFNRLGVLFFGWWLFPFVMSLVGFGIIYLGRIWAKNEEEISNKFLNVLPSNLKEFFERLY